MGLGHLRLDGFQLVEGVVSVQELVLVMPSGALIDIPGNTEPAAFNLNGTGATKTPLYLHLSSAFKVASVRTAGDPDEEGIDRVVQRVELSAQPFSDTALQVFKLAEFERSPEGAWRFVPGYLPAMLRVSGLPMFEATQKRLSSASDRLERLLLDEIQTNYLAGENQVSARECLRGLYEFRGALTDLNAGLYCHPVDVYRALRTLYIHVSVYRGVEPSAISEAYQHETPGQSFNALLGAIEQQIDLKRSETPYAPFLTREGMVIATSPCPQRRRATSTGWCKSRAYPPCSIRQASSSQASRGYPWCTSAPCAASRTSASRRRPSTTTSRPRWSSTA